MLLDIFARRLSNRAVVNRRAQLTRGSDFKHWLRALRYTGGAIEDWERVPLRHVGNTNNFLLQLLEFEVQVTALCVVVRIVNRLNRELTHALHHVRDGVCRPFSGLNQRDCVACVPDRLIQTANLLRHASRNRQAGGIILCGVNALTR